MKYFFVARVVVEPVQIQRLERERQAEASHSFRHHINPMRQMDDEMTIRAEIDTPRGLTDEQQKAFERAMNLMLREFRSCIAAEFEDIERMNQLAKKEQKS